MGDLPEEGKEAYWAPVAGQALAPAQEPVQVQGMALVLGQDTAPDTVLVSVLVSVPAPVRAGSPARELVQAQEYAWVPALALCPESVSGEA